MVTLDKKETEKFLQKVEKGLKNPTGPIPTPKVDEAIKQFMQDAYAELNKPSVTPNLTVEKDIEKEKTFLCKFRLHSYKDKLILKPLEAKNGEIPFVLQKLCKKCGYIKNEVKGIMSNM